jgi:hypothetical protein
MAETQHEFIPIENTKSWLDAGSKAFLILYGIGYFIESYYDSRYGLGYINPLRSKVGFTGIAFGLQALTAVVLFKVEEIVNNSSVWIAASKSVDGVDAALLRIPYFATWLVECCLIAFALTFIFATNVQAGLSEFMHAVAHLLPAHTSATTSALQGSPVVPSTPGPASMKDAVSMAIAFLVMATGGTLVRLRRPTRTLILISGLITTVGGVAFLAIVRRAGLQQSSIQQIFFAYIVFVALIRIAFVMFQRDRQSSSVKKKAGLFLLALTVPILYAHAIYGDVSSQWGGGRGALVVVRFERDVPPFGLTSPVHMLEETDEGFYLVGAKGNNSAVYVPRKDVKEVNYSSTSP